MEIKLKEVLRRELKGRGESINELSRKTKIPRSTLHNWQQGTLPTAKNLHYIRTLSIHFKITLSELLFNVKEERAAAEVLVSSLFTDGDRKYKITIEKTGRGGA